MTDGTKRQERSRSTSGPSVTRRTVLTSIPVLAGLGSVGTASARPTFPEILPLPTGFQPEGITSGFGTEFFVGSLATGALYRGDYRTGSGEVLVDPGDRTAVGLDFDPRSSAVFVAGGPTGQAVVYDGQHGTELMAYEFADSGTFVNDVTITRTAGFFTDSFRPVLYRVPLGPSGQLAPASAATAISLGGEYTSIPGTFNTNGMVAPPNGEFLIVVNTASGLLYNVDPETGDATAIDLDGETLENGDGMLLDGKRLYVVRNRLNAIAEVHLEPGVERGTVVDHITHPAFDIPTTVAGFGRALYAVNARFGTPDPATAKYSVVRVPK